MSSQLEQLLGYLEREGVSEVVVGTNKPVVMRTAKGVTNLTARPLSNEQLATILRGTEVEALIPRSDGDSAPCEVRIGRRLAIAQITRLADTITISLSRSERGGPPLPTQSIAKVATPVAEPTVTFSKPSSAPQAKAPSTAPRAKTPSTAPRTKTPSTSPRTKTGSTAPRTKQADAVPKGRTTTGTRMGTPVSPIPFSPTPAPNAFGSLTLDDDGIDLGAIGAPLDLDRSPASPAAPAARDLAGSIDAIDLGMSLELEDMGSRSQQQPPAAHHSPPQFAQPAPQHPAPYSPPQFAQPAPQQPGHYSPQHLQPAPAVSPNAGPRHATGHATASHRQSARADSGAFGAIVRAARERGASDLHVAAARATSVRVNGELVALDDNSAPLTADAAADLLLPLLDDAMQAQLHQSGYVDLALDAPDGGRLRANICRQQQGLKGTFRLALAAPATLEQLSLPAELAKVVHHHQGLVVIAGPSGHGKTTTLAALVDLLNSSRPYHILTIEDPIEIVHPRKQAVISQREAGRHTQSFARGLKASLREDPDVIVIGELRDRDSVEIALTAAETGHLVIATMSTPSAAKTIDRLVDMFPPEDHSQVRASVAGALRAIVAQRLLPKRGGGVVPAVELVTGVLPLAVMIREDKLYQLPNLMQRGRAFGMIRFDESLAELVRSGRVDEEAALAVAESKKDLALTLHPAAPAVQAKTSPLWGFGKKEQR